MRLKSISSRVAALGMAVASGGGVMPALSQTSSDLLPVAGDWQIRARTIILIPDESSDLSIGGEVTLDSAISAELDFTYFWTDSFATELILATTRHTVGAVDTAIGGVDIGNISVLPPTLLAQYHFRASDRVKPYLGAGLNYTIFYNIDDADVVNKRYDDSFGFAVQAGVDIYLNDRWFINADAKRYWLSTDAVFNDGAVTADVDIDPWIFAVGLGIRF